MNKIARFLFGLLFLFVSCKHSKDLSSPHNYSKPPLLEEFVYDSLSQYNIITIGEAVHFNKTMYDLQLRIIDSLKVSNVFIENSYFTIKEILSDTSDTKYHFKDYSSLVRAIHNKGVNVIGMNPGYLKGNVLKFASILKSADTVLYENLNEIFRLDSFNEAYYWYRMSDSELTQLKLRLDTLGKRISSRIPDFIFDEGCYFIKKDLEYVYLKRTIGDKERDSIMFRIIMDHNNSNKKSVVLAHNFHLTLNNNYKSNLGHFLKSKFGNRMFSIGTDFYSGSYLTNNNYHSKEYEFSQVEFNGLKHSIWRKNDWTNLKQPFYYYSKDLPNSNYKTKWAGGMDYKKLILSINYRTDFDLIIFIPTVEAGKL
ncbi:MAG: erythromycin esterase family protein [Bacteroidia bacterium]|nr:erythromycin esterase family protein [Bacteroidia bacterium]